ncbi:MAG: GNAT family N-acetyltransferase [Aestuariibacter sp.]
MILDGYKTILKPVTQAHLEILREWRNDPQISQFMLSQDRISEGQQQQWFNKISSDDTQQHWVIYFRGKPIGSANLKSVEGVRLQESRNIEPGLYIAEPSLRGNIIAFAPSLLLLDYCFDRLAAHQLQAQVKKTNTAALNYNKKLGYSIVKEGELIEIALQKDDYIAATKQIKSFLSR